MDTGSLPATSTGYLGKQGEKKPKNGREERDERSEEDGSKDNQPEAREYTLAELVNDGPDSFELVKNRPGVTQYVKSKESGRIMSVIVPGDHPHMQENARQAVQTIEKLTPLCCFPEDNRRGTIRGLRYGISFGGGQQRPMMLTAGVRNARVLEQIRQCLAFQHIAAFMSVCFLTWAPALFLYYARITGTLLNHHRRTLQLPFKNSIFAAFNLNFGPRTVCLPHRDSKNLAFGWCGITALGNYDFTKGGHLVLWDLKMVIEFPPGTTIFIPSAVLCHFNTTIQPGETRYSFTMYTAGGLFRWVEHGFRLEHVYEKTVDAVREAMRDSKRWARGLSLFSTMDELLNPITF
ncbi:hypothetical protein V5O48_016471 [Marasmius crinis-equi]|uniref:Uncharacterized protein n=1 Tax=Marasmius crinis-equi TaxID=585013 RepID=A0ABR3ERP9_9AGAR